MAGIGDRAMDICVWYHGGISILYIYIMCIYIYIICIYIYIYDLYNGGYLVYLLCKLHVIPIPPTTIGHQGKNTTIITITKIWHWFASRHWGDPYSAVWSRHSLRETGSTNMIHFPTKEDIELKTLGWSIHFWSRKSAFGDNNHTKCRTFPLQSPRQQLLGFKVWL